MTSTRRNADGSVPLTYARIIAVALPIVAANCAVPLLGLVDTAIIGNVGGAQDLGAIALGALVFSFVYWGFGFLRMGTTGFVAQAVGAGDEAEVRATLARGLLLAGGLGVALVALQWPLLAGARWALDGSAAVEGLMADYVRIRLWGAPAALATFALLGAFIGLGATRLLLVVQLAMNGLNIALDLLFAGALGWGVRGVALGTALSEWAALGLGLALARGLLRRRHTDDEPFIPTARLVRRGPLLQLLRVNRDLMIRTLLMLSAFAWFTNQGARFGDVVLAANHILLQLISFCAFFLDGFAFAAESFVGRALGAGRRDLFDAALRRTTALALATAALLAAGTALGGAPLVALLTDLDTVRAASEEHLPWAALYVLLSFGAFQLDGVFIGATRAAVMRDMSALSVAIFAGAAWALGAIHDNRALWIAFVVYVSARGLTLAARLPALRRDVVAGGARNDAG